MKEKYSEIWRLKDWCERLGIPHSMQDLYDGYKLCFYDKARGNFVQHKHSYGAEHGCVEPEIDSKFDYRPVSLRKAKWLVLLHWFRLRRTK